MTAARDDEADRELARLLFDAIKHGDAGHQEWLSSKCDELAPMLRILVLRQERARIMSMTNDDDISAAYEPIGHALDARIAELESEG